MQKIASHERGTGIEFQSSGTAQHCIMVTDARRGPGCQPGVRILRAPGEKVAEYQSLSPANNSSCSNPSRGNRILTRKHRKTSSLDKFHKIWGWLKLVNSQVTGVHPGLTDTSLTAVQYSANILWTLILTCSRVRWVRFYLQNNEKSSERPQLTLWRSQSYQIWSGRSPDLVS